MTVAQTPTQTQLSIDVTVRYFAAACAAAGAESQTVTVPPGTTMQGLADELARHGDALARVLPRCSYLCDGIAVRNMGMTLHAGQTVDVLPPFAGG